MNEQRIEELKNALREVVALISAREGPMPPDLKAMLVQVMEHVATRIQQLRAEEQEEPVEGLKPIAQQPEIAPAPFASSTIYGFNYDYPNQRLLVKFQGNDGVGQGPVYAYEGVQPYIFDLFKKGAAIAKTTGSNRWGKWWRGKSPSLGSAMHGLIKAGNYPYQRVG